MSAHVSTATLLIVGALAVGSENAANHPRLSAESARGEVQEAGANVLPQRLHGAVADCEGPVQQWLSFMPKRIELCGTDFGDQNFPTAGRTGGFDINGDGQLDYVTCSPQWEPLGQGGLPSTLQDLVTVSQTFATAAGMKARQVSVWRPGTAIGEAIISSMPGTTFAVVYVLGWRDIDEDGDLDLVSFIRRNGNGEGENFYFENIGYEKPVPPVAADLNRDGTVDGFDLALLLNSWGAGA